ncbi:storkhead-box protein 1 [Rhynchocyon petersi]
MAPPVQLAPGSLALVLCRLEPRAAAAGDPEEAGGRAVFRAFCRANARCFWNPRLARAASRLAFLGWLRRGVLLVRAPPASLQVLRDAWGRRALRPPRGFRIRALGDVCPVQMNLITQSQFIPLAEVLCCAISDMNAAQITVTQESLLEHLVKQYPGIAVPSQDILYATLGTLIKERKIYHTGEGYFIVTPQTYFITNAATQEKNRVLSDGRHPKPASITYLVSVDSSAELPREKAALLSHCQSCQCFSGVCTQDVREPQTIGEIARKIQESLGEPKQAVSVQNQAATVSEGSHGCGRTRPLLCTKDREKGKKFGFSLLWRNISRKEKPKVEHSNFSAQFPPEEWPVRDEDNLDNIPRDVEHEIIKRINPILTVDNLIKHTVLMQKHEERKKYNSQGTSTDMQASRHNYSSKEGVKRRQSQSAKARRHSSSQRARHRGRSQLSEPQARNIRQERHSQLPAAQPTPRSKSPSEVVEKLGGETSPVPGSHVIYKRRISNPFQGLPHRRSSVARGHKSQKTSDLKASQGGPKERTFPQPGSLNSSRTFNYETKQLCGEQHKDKPKAESVLRSNSVKPDSDDFSDQHPGYPQCSVLQVDSKCCSAREGMSGYDVCGGENIGLPEALRESCFDLNKSEETKEAPPILPLQDPSSLDQASLVGGLVAKTIDQFQGLGLFDYPVAVNHLRQPERQIRGLEEELIFTQEMETANLGHEGLSADNYTFYENHVEDDDGACSSLYLEDDDFSENEDLCEVLLAHTQYSFPGGSKWNGTEQKVTASSLAACKSKVPRFEPHLLSGNECYKPSGLLTKPRESQRPSVSAEGGGLNSETRFAFNYEEEPSVAKCGQTSVFTDGTMLDYCSTGKDNSEAKPHQVSVCDTGKKPVTWSKSPQNQEVRRHFKQKFELFSSSRMPLLSQDIQHEDSHLEGTENHSMAGDSGIDSPRTQSLTSNNCTILEGLKRSQNFLQNSEGTKSSHTLTPNPLQQLTPVINV